MVTRVSVLAKNLSSIKCRNSNVRGSFVQSNPLILNDLNYGMCNTYVILKSNIKSIGIYSSII